MPHLRADYRVKVILPIREMTISRNVRRQFCYDIILHVLDRVVGSAIGSIACCQVASIMTLSLGRDGAFLFSRYLSQVHAGLNVPVWGLLMNFTVIFLMGFFTYFRL